MLVTADVLDGEEYLVEGQEVEFLMSAMHGGLRADRVRVRARRGASSPPAPIR